MGYKKTAILLIIFSVFISSCQPRQQIAIGEEAEESAGSGFLDIGTSPSQADVFMNNIYNGKSPITLNNVAVGRHNIIIKKEGYEDFITEINIEAGRKTILETSLVLIPIVEEEPEIIEVVEEETEEIKAVAMEGNGVVNLGDEFVIYFDFSEGKFTENRQFDSDVFSKRFDKHLVFTRFDPVNIKMIDKSIENVKKEDCINVKGQLELLNSGQSLCVLTKEGIIAALGGTWENTENAKLAWKLFP